MELFGHIEDWLTKPFSGNDGQVSVVEWLAATACTVAVAFLVWHCMKGLYE